MMPYKVSFYRLLQRSLGIRGLRITVTTLILAALVSGPTLVAFAGHVAGGHLVAVGPTSAANGFPIWYKDAKGLRLELCLDLNDPLCNFPPVPPPVPDPSRPVSFPDNFPDEAFWWAAGALMDTNDGGRASLVLALEAAFAAEVPRAGDQITFGRIRIWVDNLVPGATYTVTHPYGQDVFPNVDAGTRGIRLTEDIGIGAPGDFSGALNSRIGPFLTWDPPSSAPAGYVGDPAINHTVTGSPFGTNVFRVEGPNVGAPGSPYLCNPAGPNPLDCIQTDQFSLQGKIATVAGVTALRATYSRDAAGAGNVDVYASSEPSQAIYVSSSSFFPTAMQGQGTSYFARVPFTGTRPVTATVTNVSDNPPSAKTMNVVDTVSITKAEYNSDTGELTISAMSSDANTPPTLTATGYATLTAGTLVVPGLSAPPSSVTVTSSAGGSDTKPVSVVGTGQASLPKPTVTAATTLTSTPSVSLMVTAQAGLTIRVVGGAAPVVAAATGTPQEIVVGLTPNTSNALSVTQTDSAGKTSPAATVAVVHDSIAPGAPVVSAPTTLTSASSVPLTVTAEAGSTLRITGGAAPVTAAATGAVQVITVSLTPNTVNTFSATATDGAANVSAATTVAVTQDSTPPLAPTVVPTTSLTARSSVTLTVTAEAGSVIQIAGGTNPVTATATGTAQSLVVGLTPNTTHSLAVTATDGVRNVSPAATVTVVQDSIGPAAPTVSAASTLTSSLSVTVTVTAEAGSVVRVAGGATVVTATATGSPQALAVPLLPNAPNNLSVTATDAAGNQSVATALTVVHDSTAPGVPVVSTATTLTAAPSVTLTVTAEVSSTIRVAGGAAPVTAAATGAAQSLVVGLTPNLTNTLSISAGDAAGNVSPAATMTVVQDSIAPATPVVSATTSLTSGPSVTLRVTAEAGSTIRVDGGLVPLTATASGAAQALVVGLTPNAVNSLSVTATDGAGNVSRAVTVVTTQDSLAPVPLTVVAPPKLTSAPSVTLTVTTEAGSVIQVVGGAGLVTAAATGVAQSLVVGLTPNTTHSLAVTARDAAGNTSPAATVTVVHDSIPPATPTVSAATSLTSGPSVTLTVTAEAGSIIRVDGGLVPVMAAATGAAQSLEVGLTPNANNLLSVTATDAAANVSSPAAVTVVQDQTAPAAPALSGAPAITASSAVTLVVTAEAGSTVRVAGGASTVTALAGGPSVASASGGGVPQLELVIPLNPNAVNTLSVTATDTAGNVSSASSVSVVQDSAPPGAPNVEAPSSPIAGATVNLLITAEAGSTIRIIGGAAPVTVLATGEPQTVQVGLLPNGANVLSITTTDAAANRSAATTVTIVTISTAPPGPSLPTASENPVPRVSSIGPSSAVAGGDALTLTVFGSDLTNSSVVLWNGSGRTTGFVSSSQLTTTITAADLATAGTATVAVQSPPPGGGTSGSVTFTISPRPQVKHRIFLPVVVQGLRTGW